MKSSRFIISGVDSQAGEVRMKCHSSEQPTTPTNGTLDSLVICSLSGWKSEIREKLGRVEPLGSLERRLCCPSSCANSGRGLLSPKD